MGQRLFSTLGAVGRGYACQAQVRVCSLEQTFTNLRPRWLTCPKIHNSGLITKCFLVNTQDMANIIVIEDHPPVLKLLRTLCFEAGHEVMAFDNGRAGLAAIRELNPEVALVDRRLGDCDGVDIIAEARGDSPATRFVMVSGCTDTRDIVTAIRRGACDYVTKPFTTVDIISALERALSEPEVTTPTRAKLVILCPKN
jgi:ActR/RegA family two-component response regulator